MEKEKTFKAKVNGMFEFDIEENTSLDIVADNDGRTFHIIRDGKSFKGELLQHNPQDKSFVISINGKEHEVTLEDSYDLLIKKMGLNAAAGNKMNEVKAPMPGLVLDILVEEGQTIQKGDPLIVLEAMKMENVLKASGEGTIEQIKSTKGEAVNKGDILIQLS